MIRRVTKKLRRLAVGPSAAEQQAAVTESPIEISAAQASEAVFCFAGEFGYELISWMPYLLFLKQKLGLTLCTMSRPGSRPLYSFSDEHTELAGDQIGLMWGDPSAYARIARQVAPRQLICPGRDLVNRRRITIGGFEWTTRNIHDRIRETNYARLDFSNFRQPLPFVFDRPYVVINNKYQPQWEYDRPINCFERGDLIALREMLTKLGFAVVYNHFIEPTACDRNFALEDADIFGKTHQTYDLRPAYAAAATPESRNRLQLSVYNNAAAVIGPQGGNLYLPAICRKPLFILMRGGDYIDYLELGRIYGVPVESFYEPRHLLCWLRQTTARAITAQTTDAAAA